MQTNSKQFNPEKYLDGLQKKQEAAIKKEQQGKEILKQKILSKWSQQKSVFFWNAIFLSVDLVTLEMVFGNVMEMVHGEHPVHNPAALMVRILQNMGKVERKGGKTNGK